MNKFAYPAAALFLLTACARVDPIDENAVDEVSPPPTLNEILAENEADQAGIGDMRWFIDGDGALFGAPESEGVLAMQCEGNALEISRYADSSTGAGTLTFSASAARIASVAVAAQESELSGRVFTAQLAPGDIANDLVEVFEGNAPIDVTMTGADPLIVPADPQVRDLVERCVGGAEDGTAEAPTNEIS